MVTGVLFDVLAKLPINYMRAPYYTSEREMAKALLADLGPGDLLLLDRGYPGYQIFHAMIAQGADFLIRLPKDGLFRPIQEFLARGKRDGQVTLSPPQPLLRKEPTAHYQPLTLRVVAVALPGTKETAVLSPP